MHNKQKAREIPLFNPSFLPCVLVTEPQNIRVRKGASSRLQTRDSRLRARSGVIEELTLAKWRISARSVKLPSRKLTAAGLFARPMSASPCCPQLTLRAAENSFAPAVFAEFPQAFLNEA
jgi:hypothetical protein